MGKPAPGVPLHIITSAGTEAAVGKEGDMAVLMSDKRGTDEFFGVFDGYVNDDNTLTRREKSFTNNGEVSIWYLTGDRAKRDADGYFWFVGRSDDVINSSGYRIGSFESSSDVHTLTNFTGPFEVESTLQKHPAVAESAVISSPDPTRGEVVKAFVVLTLEYQNGNQRNLRQELQAFCKKNAAPYKYPRKIDFVSGDFLPKTASGKIQRSELRKLEWKKDVKAKL
jgi:medium-chain acyl-CoA synthetase